MSTITAGQAFTSPVSQTILPVAEVVIGYAFQGRPAPVSVRIVGFYPIALTEFDGTETTVTLASGPVNVVSLKLPQDVVNGRVPELMVASFTTHEANQEAWRGHTSFVEAAQAGYYSDWIMPASLITHRHGLGTLVGSLSTNMDAYTWATAAPPTPPDAVDGELKWAVSLSLTNNNCGFFDFNWIDLFKAKAPAGFEPASITGLAIVPTKQPVGLPFKSTVLQHPEAGPNNTVIYNTVRIIRMLQNVPVGDHEFEFSIGYTDKHNQQASITVKLTLTVI